MDIRKQKSDEGSLGYFELVMGSGVVISPPQDGNHLVFLSASYIWVHLVCFDV